MPVKTEFAISNWRPLIKGSLRGFFSVQLPSGLILHECSAFEKDGKRWINGPQKSFAKDGKFRDAVLDALDEHLGSRR